MIILLSSPYIKNPSNLKVSLAVKIVRLTKIWKYVKQYSRKNVRKNERRENERKIDTLVLRIQEKHL